jgi:hypothetical protein
VKLTGRLDGLAQLNARLAAVADEAAFAPDLAAAAEDIRAAAATGVGEDSALARSLAVTAEAGGYAVGTPLGFGWHREFGSLKRAARPWLAPAAEAARRGFVARIAARLEAMLRRAAPGG